jgi:putative heme-binding domain-containing protein
MPEDRIWSIVAYLRSLSAPAMEAQVAGDPAAGHTLFREKKCSNCHMIRGKGGHLGPDLTNAGATRTVKQLRESIADPSARIAEGFRRVEVVTADGKMLKGVAKNHTNYSVQMLTADGRLHLLDIAQLKNIKLEQTSPMPDLKLSQQELDALVAFLSTQAVRQ